jgi:short-chain Z-isoprenyl diphosphate synthase
VSTGPTPAQRRATRPAQVFSSLRRLSTPLYWLYEKRLMRAVRRSGTLPKHIGIIMDGNRRFAKTVGLDLKAGHDYGADKAREVLDWCLELGIRHVTLWGFSTDNRGRAPDEVSHLHSLFASQARRLIDDPRVHKNRVRVRIIGEIEDFPEEAREALRQVEKSTEAYGDIYLNIALGYGGREEIVSAVRKLLRSKLDDGCDLDELVRNIDAEEIGRHLYTAGMPDPDFVIRTSGEVRMSGFLLWQTAYSEFYFCDAFWPEFRKIDFLRAMRSFQARERRFGR